MRFGPIETQDRLGRTLTLRNAEPSDAAALLECMNVTAGETPFLSRELDEFKLTLEQEEAFLKAKVDVPRDLLMVAEVDGRLAGSCMVAPVMPHRKQAHRCAVAIALYREFWGAGIGELMMRSLLDVAKQAGFEQAELEVVCGNERAISLYRRLGFESYATLPRFMKYADGSYADAEYMMKQL